MTGQPYAVDDIVETASKVAGRDQREFFEKYVRGTERLPLEAFLNDAGFEGFSKPYAGEFYVFLKRDAGPQELSLRRSLLNEK